MPSRKPTLGYSSRTDAVLAFRAEGISTREIAARIGIDVCAVSALENSAARRRGARASERTVVFPTELLDALLPHASRRSIATNELARQIVETVVEARLVDAVLDDSPLTRPSADAEGHPLPQGERAGAGDC